MFGQTFIEVYVVKEKCDVMYMRVGASMLHLYLFFFTIFIFDVWNVALVLFLLFKMLKIKWNEILWIFFLMHLINQSMLFFSFFLCCPIMCLYVLCYVLCCLLRFPHRNDVRFVFTSSYLYRGLCLHYVSCVWSGIVMSNTNCVVILLFFSSSCVPYIASFSGLSIFDCSFGIT
jgi:hypothetical protein